MQAEQNVLANYPVYEAGEALCFYAESPIPSVCLKCGSLEGVERAPTVVHGSRGKTHRSLHTHLPFCELHRVKLLRKGWRWYELGLLLWGVGSVGIGLALGGGDFFAKAGAMLVPLLMIGGAFFLRTQRKNIIMYAEWIDDDKMLRLRGVHPDARQTILNGSSVGAAG